MRDRINVRNRNTPDISALLHFTFNEKVLYADHEESFPASKEKIGRWMGVAENKGDALTYWILAENETLLARSCVRPLSEAEPNLRAEDVDPPDESKSDGFEGRDVKPVQLDLHSEIQNAKPPDFDPTMVIGATFIREDDRQVPTKTTVMEVDEDTGRLLLEYANGTCLLYTSPSPRDLSTSRMPSSA